jgi:protoporphyrinogen oxidase
MAEVAVVGGGILGLTLGLRLAQRGHRVRVLEGSAELGGLAAPQELGGFTWDRFYHVTLESDRALMGLLGEIGLLDALRWGTTRTGFYTDGRFHSMSSAVEFLRFPPLGLLDKARLAATILRAANIADAAPLERERVDVWLRRWSGERTFQRIWRPLLEAKLGENWRLASASFIWAIIARMYAARRSGLKRERFGYVAGGYATTLAALRRAFESAGGVVELGQRVERVEALRDGEKGVALHISGASRRFDSVVLTVPCGVVARLCPSLNAEEQARLGRVVYQGVICASLLLDRPLSGYYVTNITESGFPFTTVVEMTALVPPSEFGGLTLAYVPRYCTASDAWWAKSDAEVLDELQRGLRRLFPALPADAIKHASVARAREVQAVPTLNYSRDACPAMTTSVRGLFVVNSAQIVNGTLNANETVALAERSAPALHAALAAAGA